MLKIQNDPHFKQVKQHTLTANSLLITSFEAICFTNDFIFGYWANGVENEEST